MHKKIRTHVDAIKSKGKKKGGNKKEGKDENQQTGSREQSVDEIIKCNHSNKSY